MLLAGDIGGTKTSLAIYAPEGSARLPLVEATFPSDAYPSLEAIAHEFLSHVTYQVTWASFGVAGPVVNGHVQATNLPWEMDEAELRAALGLDAAYLLNDLEAIASSVPRLLPEDVQVVHPGVPVPGGAIGVVAPGTGLGEGFLTWTGDRYRAHPSEGGHTDFAPTDETQLELLRYLLARLGHVSYEWVCAGVGIPNLYAFFRDTGRAAEPAWLREQLAQVDDPTPVIVTNALSEDSACALCRLTLEMFVSVLGAEAGNLTLKVLATGGIYIGGGIPPRILPFLMGERFRRAFLNKGRFARLLENVPVYVIMNPKAALLGAAAYGLEKHARG